MYDNCSTKTFVYDPGCWGNFWKKKENTGSNDNINYFTNTLRPAFLAPLKSPHGRIRLFMDLIYDLLPSLTLNHRDSGWRC
jgi:hypothetical protein